MPEISILIITAASLFFLGLLQVFAFRILNLSARRFILSLLVTIFLNSVFIFVGLSWNYGVKMATTTTLYLLASNVFPLVAYVLRLLELLKNEHFIIGIDSVIEEHDGKTPKHSRSYLQRIE